MNISDKKEIEALDLSDDKTFRAFLHEIIFTYSLHESDVADYFSVSVPTLKRWLSGVTSPHPLMRNAHKRYAIKLLDKRLASFNQEVK